VSTQDVARSNLAGERQSEISLGRGGICENVDTAVPLESACFWARSHLSDGGQEPVGRPALATIHAEGESAGPAGHAGKLPAANKSVHQAAVIARESPTFAKGQIGNPVEVELVSKIKIGGGAGEVRGK